MDITPTYPLLTAEREIVTPDPAAASTQPIGGFMASPTGLQQGNLTLNGVGEQILVGAATATLTGIGVFIGNAGDNTYDFRAGDPSGNYIQWDASAAALTIVGSITATTGTIGGFSIGADYIRDSANTFGLASTVTTGDDVRFWAGAAFASRATAPARITEAGAAFFSNVTISGGSLSGTPISAIPNDTNTDISLLEKTHNLTFSVTNATTVAWTSGTITLSNGRTFSISSGNTGSMAALTYIYLDPAVSSTVLQITTTYSTALGANKALIGTAKNGSTTASFIPYGPGTALINGDLIGALSIAAANIASAAITTAKIATGAVTANEIAATTITAAKIVAGTITTTEIAANTIVAGNIAASTITAAKMSVSQLSAIAADLGTITAGTVTGATIRTSASNPKFNMTSTSFQGINSGGTVVFEVVINGANAGDVTIGNTASARYVFWDDSAGTLTINGFVQGSKGSFGGDGSDGALAISSGTTTLSFGSASYIVKNYSSISITGTGKLATSTPATTGSALILKSQGAITLTASAPCIDVSAMGAAGGAAVSSSGAQDGNPGTDGTITIFSTHKGLGGTGTASNGGSGTINTVLYPATFDQVLNRYPLALVGSGGGSGEIGSSGATNTSGAGGRGGGALIIECNGAWNFMTASGITVAGANGGNASLAPQAAGGGGGGSGGFCLVLYNILTANSGTVVVTAGVGGNSLGPITSVGGSGGGFLTNGSNSTTASAGGKNGGDGAVGSSTIAANQSFA